MHCPIAIACSSAALFLVVGAAGAETLKVGPQQKYTRPSQAFQAAKDGDVIEIDAAGAYGGDVGHDPGQPAHRPRRRPRPREASRQRPQRRAARPSG